MANAHSTLASLFTDIAKAIRSKTGGTASIVADNFPTAISSIEVKENLTSELSTQDGLISQINTALAGKVGKELPVLSNPAGAGNIEAGYQAIDGQGNLMIGTFVPESVTVTNVDSVLSNYSQMKNTPITIPAIEGKANFIIMCMNYFSQDRDYGHCFGIVGDNNFSYAGVSYNPGAITREGLSATFKLSTGKIAYSSQTGWICVAW